MSKIAVTITDMIFIIATLGCMPWRLIKEILKANWQGLVYTILLLALTYTALPHQWLTDLFTHLYSFLSEHKIAISILLIASFLYFRLQLPIQRKYDFLKGKYLERSASPPQTSQAAKLYHTIFPDDEPITDPKKDCLDRKEFAKQLAQHCMNRPERPFTYGINGVWGVGKTSLINLVFCNMEREGFEFNRLVFESWHYQESGKIAQILFNEIRHIVKQYSSHPLQVSSLFKTLAKSISLTTPPPGFRVNFTLPSLPIRADHAKYKLKELLKEDLNKYLRPLIVFIDDLDRLEKEELHAVLRSVRLLSGLPGIKFILAYDRKLIDQLLFPDDDATGMIARDYLAKIVQQEITCAIPPEDIRKQFLNNLIVEQVEKNPGEHWGTLQEFLSDNKINHAIFDLIPTPREIKRILAATIWIFSLGSKNQDKRYNIIDLFILTIIQYRLPKIYQLLRDNSESIIEELKIKLGMLSDRERTRSKGIASILNTSDTQKLLVNALLPPLFNHDKQHNSESFLQRRRFCHPGLYYSYFQYIYPNDLQRLQTITTLLNKIHANITNKDSEPNFSKILLENIDTLRLDQYWNIFIDELPELYADSLLIGVAQVVHEIINTGTIKNLCYILSERCINILFNKIPDEEKRNQAAQETVRHSSSYGFAAFFVKLLTDPDDFRPETTLHDAPTKQHLYQKLSEKFTTSFKDQSIFSANDDDFYAIAGLNNYSSDPERIQGKILIDLDKSSQFKVDLFRLLNLYRFDLQKMLEKIDIGQLNWIINENREKIAKQPLNRDEQTLLSSIENIKTS